MESSKIAVAQRVAHLFGIGGVALPYETTAGIASVAQPCQSQKFAATLRIGIYEITLKRFLPLNYSKSRFHNFYSASILLLIANNLASALHYVFQAMMKQHFGEKSPDYGTMNSLIAMGVFLTLPMTIYINTLARRWAEDTHVARFEEMNRLWYTLFIAVAGFCTVNVLLALMFLPWIAWWLNTDRLLTTAIAVMGAGIGILLSLSTFFAIARQWFGFIAIGSLVGALLRIFLGWLGIQWHMPLSGALIATNICGILLTILIFATIPRPRWKDLCFRELIPHKKEWIGPCFVGISSFCIIGVDLLVVRRIYNDFQADVFSQVTTLARIMMFLVGPLVMVIFPKSATSLQKEPSLHEKNILKRALGLGSIALLGAALVIHLFASLGFQLLSGSSDAERVYLLRTAAWCFVPLSLCQLVVPALFAKRQERLLFEFTLISFLIPIGLFFFQGNLVYAFYVEGAVGLLLLGYTAFRLKTSGQGSRPA